jgi:ribosomal protein S18 acetylase RimI-like enzyme
MGLTDMELLRFVPAYVAVVASWPRSPEEAVMWCGEREFPVPAQTVANWQQDDEARAYMLIADDAPIGYGELWLDAEEKEIELARIIIAPGARGKGYGRALVQLLLSEAVNVGCSDIFMRVHPDNGIALMCYRGAGFVVVDAKLAEAWNAGQPVNYVWLRHGGAEPGH